MLTIMKTRPAVVAFLLISLIGLGGCAAPAASEPAPSPTAIQRLQSAGIVTIDDGIAWARGLGDWATATELSQGIVAIGKLVPDQNLWFEYNNEIGQNLISLNADILNDPDNATTKIDDLNAIIDDLEAAIAKGGKP